MPRLQPVEILELKGAYEHNPKRRRPPAPKSTHPIGDAPSSFTRDEKAMWKEILHNAIPETLTSADRYLVETFTKLIAKQRRREDMTGAELSVILSCIGKLGLSPVDRMKLATPPAEKAKSPYSEFIN